MEGQKRDVLAICVTLFVLFFCIAVLFPYTGDDWTWGSDAGVRDLERFFDGLNGRYAGNLLVMALTRNKLLDAVIMASSYTLVCYFCYEYADCKSKMLIWLAAVLFYIMPKEIWVQSVVWTSGFSNYVPSTLFTAAFLLSARKLIDMTQLKMDRISVKTVWMFSLGFLGALFLENITVFNILFALFVIFCTFLRFRKCCTEHVGFLLGAILGAYVMFSNSAYHKIVQGNDSYRNTPTNMGEIIEIILENAQEILTYIIYNNLLLCGIVTAFLVVLWECRSASKDRGIGGVPVWAHLGCFALVLCKDSVICLLGQWMTLSELRVLLLEIGVALLYVSSIFVIIICCVEFKQRMKLLLPLFCVAGSLMPLLVVRPIGARCVFSGYFFMMVFTVELVAYLRIRLLPEAKWLRKLICLIVIMQTLVFINIYYPVYHCENLRSVFLKRQIEDGKRSVLICDLPNRDYLWNSDISIESLAKRYRQFHNLDKDIQFRFVPLSDLKSISENYK